MNFLFNVTLLEIGDDRSPFQDPGFPLSRAQYETIGIDQLGAMLAEEFTRDPNALAHHPGRILRLLWMMHDKAGVNALRLTLEGGTRMQYGLLPELAFAGLQAMAANGTLTPAAVEEAVWSKLQR